MSRMEHHEKDDEQIHPKRAKVPCGWYWTIKINMKAVGQR